MSSSLLPVPVAIPELLALVRNSVSSGHSKRIYEKAVVDFLLWVRGSGEATFGKAAVQRYRSELVARGLAASTVNQKMSAIRKLANEMADNNWLPREAAAAIGNIRGVEGSGRRTGRWLTVSQTEALLNAPDASTLKGLRDRALLAVLVGSGIRRGEAAALCFEDIQERESRWVIVDLRGKRSRIRSIPIAAWTKMSVDAWRSAAGLSEGRVFRAVDKADKISGEGLTAQAIYEIVHSYGAVIGGNLAPHDLRRTFARLAHKGRAALDQIQLSLGHASLTTTERYLGVRLDLQDAPCDHLGVRLCCDERLLQSAASQ